jgi:hypothetical protein
MVSHNTQWQARNLLMVVYYSLAAEGPQRFKCGFCFYIDIMKRISGEMVVHYSNVRLKPKAGSMDEKGSQAERRRYGTLDMYERCCKRYRSQGR